MVVCSLRRSSTVLAEHRSVYGKRKYIFTDYISQPFMTSQAPIYADSIFEKRQALEKYAGFIDGTVLGIVKLEGNGM